MRLSLTVISEGNGLPAHVPCVFQKSSQFAAWRQVPLLSMVERFSNRLIKRVRKLAGAHTDVSGGAVAALLLQQVYCCRLLMPTHTLLCMLGLAGNWWQMCCNLHDQSCSLRECCCELRAIVRQQLHCHHRGASLQLPNSNATGCQLNHNLPPCSPWHLMNANNSSNQRITACTTTPWC